MTKLVQNLSGNRLSLYPCRSAADKADGVFGSRVGVVQGVHASVPPDRRTVPQLPFGDSAEQQEGVDKHDDSPHSMTILAKFFASLSGNFKGETKKKVARGLLARQWHVFSF